MRNCVDSCRIYTVRLSPALNGSSEIRRFERSDAIEIRNRIIIFDFYTGLTHIVSDLSCSIALIMSYRQFPSFRPLSSLSQDGACDLLLWAEQAGDEAVWSEGLVVREGVREGAVLWDAHLRGQVPQR